MSANERPKCLACHRPVENTAQYETFEKMHWVCFHYEYEHGDIDIDRACRDPGCPSRMVDREAPPDWFEERRRAGPKMTAQRPRGSRPDATSDNTWYLFKNVTRLRLTYQIRMLTFAATDAQRRLEIRVPEGCSLSQDLQDFVKTNRAAVRLAVAS